MLEALKTIWMGFLFILLFLIVCGMLVAMIVTTVCILDGFIILTIAYPGILGPIIVVAIAFMVGLVIRRLT